MTFSEMVFRPVEYDTAVDDKDQHIASKSVVRGLQNERRNDASQAKDTLQCSYRRTFQRGFGISRCLAHHAPTTT
jgi:hypothetical protein